MKSDLKPRRKNPSVQKGSVLLFVLIVLTVLSIASLSSLADNHINSVLVRNNQLTLEAFNGSYSEIQAQVENVIQRPLSSGPPDYILEFLVAGIGSSISSTSNTAALMTSTSNLTKKVDIVMHSGCFSAGSSIDLNSCQRIRVDTTTTIENANISSVQHQLYDYELAN